LRGDRLRRQNEDSKEVGGKKGNPGELTNEKTRQRKKTIKEHPAKVTSKPPAKNREKKGRSRKGDITNKGWKKRLNKRQERGTDQRGDQGRGFRRRKGLGKRESP